MKRNVTEMQSVPKTETYNYIENQMVTEQVKQNVTEYQIVPKTGRVHLQRVRAEHDDAGPDPHLHGVRADDGDRKRPCTRVIAGRRRRRPRAGGMVGAAGGCNTCGYAAGTAAVGLAAGYGGRQGLFHRGQGGNVAMAGGACGPCNTQAMAAPVAAAPSARPAPPTRPSPRCRRSPAR